jgi:hypothetical protein
VTSADIARIPGEAKLAQRVTLSVRGVPTVTSIAHCVGTHFIRVLLLELELCVVPNSNYLSSAGKEAARWMTCSIALSAATASGRDCIIKPW